MNNFISHGDVNLHPITKEEYEKLAVGAQEIKHNGSFVLALGETTGHKHVLVAEPPSLVIHELSDGRGRLLWIKGRKASIVHEEHGVLPARVGYYIQVQERELDHFGLSVERKVID